MNRRKARNLALYGAKLSVLGGLYVLTGKFGLSLDAVGGFATLIWPPTGIALAALMLFGIELWPAVFIGAFMLNLMTGAPMLAALGIGAGNMLESAAGILLLRHFFGDEFSFKRLHDVLGYVFICALGATALAATMGVSSLLLSGTLASGAAFDAWRAWWVGDMLGALIVTPLIVLWITDPPSEHATESPWEALVLACVVAASEGFVFLGNLPFLAPFYFLILLPPIWVLFRFGMRGMVTANAALAFATIIGTLMRLNPFASRGATPADGLLLAQLFVASLIISFLVFSAVVEEREAQKHEIVRLLSDKNRAITLRDEFISIASHELKTPVTSLKLFAEVAASRAGSADEAAGSLLAKMRSQIDKLAALIDDLLNVSKIELGSLELAKEEFDLEALVREVASDLETGSGKQFAVDGSLARRVAGDRERIGQVLVNLLGNAIKYSKNGGRIEIALVETQDGAAVTVRDYGIGIGAEHLGRIFERFYRVSDAKTKTYPGLGIGLYISSEIVKRHGGTISVASEPGKGSAFSFTLPYRAQAA